ncbi:MAG: Hsp70 family protein, partial [Anaerolineaceae bacterium]|nr:Hsp70 family protein [Anaerolineaceae bacterium]
SRSRFEQMTADLVERLRGPFNAALKDADLNAAVVDEVVLVGGATRMPMVQELVRSITGKEPNKGVNPDEVVAIGAAIQAGVLSGQVKDVLLLDVTPLSLGVETLGGVMTSLIERNTTIPARKTEVFSTAENSQTAVDIHILQGERPMAADNMSLGRFRLEGIPAAPRGIPQIEVTFDIDANGILNVSARDKASGKEQRVTITASTNRSKGEIENLVEEAKKHQAEDSQRRELADARNMADNTAYQAETWLKEQADGVDSTQRQALEEKINSLRQAMKGDDISRLRSDSHDLQQALSQAQQSKTGQPGASTPDSGGEKPGGDDVVEGEFRET